MDVQEGTPMKFSFGKVMENEIDLVIINSLASDKEFANLIFAELNIPDFEIFEIVHSLVDTELGESDIVVFGESAGRHIAILIEDKINAGAMPDQAGRYKARADKLVREGIVDIAEYMLIAPSHYIETDSEASKYPHYIEYEKMLSYFTEDGDALKSSIIEQAMNQEKSGYTPVRNDAVTEFWQKYYQYRRKNYPELILSEVEGARGSKAAWPYFKTNNKKMRIVHKSERGYVDLELPGLGGFEDNLKLQLEGVIAEDMYVANASKSAAIRIRVPKEFFDETFEEQTDSINACFEAVLRLFIFSEHINYTVLANGCILHRN